MNLKINQILLSSLVSITLTGSIVSAQNRKGAPPAAAKSKTVGELLANASKNAAPKSKTDLPTANLGFKAEPTKVNLDSVKPPKSSQLMQKESGSARVQYEKVLDQQINELYKMTQRYKTTPNRGELWLRLAELYVEKATLVDGRRQDEYDARLKAFQEGKTKTKPSLNLREAKEYNRKAVQLYEWFYRDFPKDPKVPQALFFLGYNFFELGDQKKGTEFYDTLIKRYPKSEFVGEARFAMAEFHFENDQWKKAYAEYTPLIKDKKHRLNEFAVYKGAWCLYRLGETSKGLTFLEHIIRSNRAAAADKSGRNASHKIRLETEALRDIVTFYLDIGDATKAPGYFRSLVGAQKSLPYLERLAYGYSDRGNKDTARDLFKYLIAANPKNPKTFEYQYQIVQNYYYIKNNEKFKAELYTWIRDYDKNSEWHKANGANKELITNAYKLRETTLRNYVLQQHQAAQNSRAAFTQGQAVEGYGLYLKEFSDSELIGDMRFYYGELLYDLNRFDESAAQYQWVVDNAQKSKFYDKAAQNLLITAERSIPSDSEMQKRAGTSTDPMPLDPKVARYIKVSEWYASKFPKSERAVEVKFRVGRLFYQHNQFDPAIKAFKEIVSAYPTTQQAEFSANLLLDIYNLKKDYVGLEKTGAELLAVPAIASSKTGNDIRGIMEKASFKRGQDLEGLKKYDESAKAFEAFAKTNPKSALAMTAIFNAAVNYERAGNNASAISNYQAVMASGDPEAVKQKPKIPRLLAKLYQDSAQFEEAARLYKVAAKADPKDPLAANYIFNAAVLYEALGNTSEAIRAYKEFTEANKKTADNLEAIFSMAQIHRKAGQLSAAVTRYMEYVEQGGRNQERVVEAAYWVAVLSPKFNAITRAKEWRQKTLSIQKRFAPNKKGVGATYAAKFKLEDAEATFREMRAIKFPQNPARQKEAADRKINLMTRLSGELSEVIKFDSAEEIVNALAILGDSNLNMAQTITGAPFPAGLNAEESKQYKEGIEKFAEPFNVKAKEGFKAAVARGYELEVYNKGFQVAYAFMASQDSKTYYNGGEAALETRMMNWLGE